ncbi:hypothetical protein SAMN02745221_00915 [Thermosyntropha lipolytica DSM 11003]|uniref:Uncharacterized protein n=1 Tax=Thermosyntropha lipolytica DSM 11003 TaxID=1123382 RepID=A0A1M5MFR7_9FIRM|nr:hypothetical protein [Thermosyntropha lipolytica]SHG76022.1 hypothetical protein SAMN02745221_00915 [Thermosyntropha lipolytica DSM 11003]
MDKKLKIGLDVLVYVLQLLLITGAFIVQYFSTRRMGMFRYLVYKNQKWAPFFTPDWMTVYKGLWLVLAAGAVVLVITKWINIKGYYRWINVVLLLFLLFMTGFYLFTGDVNAVRGLYYLLIALGASLVVQFIRVFISLKN